MILLSPRPLRVGNSRRPLLHAAVSVGWGECGCWREDERESVNPEFGVIPVRRIMMATRMSSMSSTPIISFPGAVQCSIEESQNIRTDTQQGETPEVETWKRTRFNPKHKHNGKWDTWKSRVHLKIASKTSYSASSSSSSLIPHFKWFGKRGTDCCGELMASAHYWPCPIVVTFFCTSPNHCHWLQNGNSD